MSKSMRCPIQLKLYIIIPLVVYVIFPELDSPLAEVIEDLDNGHRVAPLRTHSFYSCLVGRLRLIPSPSRAGTAVLLDAEENSE
jgi:hypothetical protein